MARDQFPSRGALDSATDAYAVTPNNDADLADVPRALWVGGGGNISLVMASGTVTLEAVPDGTLLPVRPSRVRATGTTATAIVALL